MVPSIGVEEKGIINSVYLDLQRVGVSCVNSLDMPISCGHQGLDSGKVSCFGILHTLSKQAQFAAHVRNPAPEGFAMPVRIWL